MATPGCPSPLFKTFFNPSLREEWMVEYISVAIVQCCNSRAMVQCNGTVQLVVQWYSAIIQCNGTVQWYKLKIWHFIKGL